MSISISTVGKALGCLIVVTSLSYVLPVKAQSISNRGNLVAQVPPSSSSLEQRAATAYTQGDAALAMTLYSQLLQQQPTSYVFQVRLAVSMLNAGPEFFNRSYEAFQKAQELAPTIDEPLVYLATIDESWERPREALAKYQKAFQLNPSNQGAFLAIQRLQAQVALPALPEGLEVIDKRPLGDYLAAIEPNSRLLAGLQAQRAMVEGFAWRNALPYVSLGYSWSTSTSTSASLNPSDTCVNGRQVSGASCSGNGSSNGFSIGVNWNLSELLTGSNNQLRLRGYEDEITKNLQSLKTETQRLFVQRGSLIEEFRQLAWETTMDPTDRDVRFKRRDRYLQILYITQQIYNITGLY